MFLHFIFILVSYNYVLESNINLRGDILSIKTTDILVEDMVCTSCEKIISDSIKKLTGILEVNVDYKTSLAKVTFDSTKCSYSRICSAIESSGYTIKISNNKINTNGSSTTFKEIISILAIIALAFVIIALSKNSGTFNISTNLGTNTTYLMLFVIGIFTSLHCVGMCGGIMLSQSITINKGSKLKNLLPSILYNVGRLTSYTLLGGLVGALGSVFSLSLSTQASISILAGLFMIIMGFNMSGFKLFRGINLKLPFSNCKSSNKQSSPLIVGLLNGFMPCGPLQTMQLYALASGSFFKGASSMFIFGLGTIPLMLIFSLAINAINMKNTKKLIKFSGILIVILGILMANRGFTLLGVNIPINNLLSFNSKNSSNVITDENKATLIDGKQVVKIKATSSGYSPKVVFIEKNLPTEIIFEGETITSCNNEVIFPSMNIKQKLTKGETKINFTAGDKDINYSCWMGMLSGSIKVVDTLDSVSDKDLSSAESELSQNSGGSCCQGSSSTNQAQEFLVYGLPLSEIPTDRLVKKSSISGSSQALSISGIDTYFEPLVSILKTNIPAKLTFNLTKMPDANGTYNIVEFSSQEIVGSFTISDFKGSIDITLNKSSIYFIEKDFSIVGTIKTSASPETEDIEKVRSELID